MSALEVQLIRDPAQWNDRIALRRRGFGTVVFDQIPEETMRYIPHYSDIGVALRLIGENFSAVYDYCRPQGSDKSITMSFEHAKQTAQFLKEII